MVTEKERLNAKLEVLQKEQEQIKTAAQNQLVAYQGAINALKDLLADIEKEETSTQAPESDSVTPVPIGVTPIS
jgi:hypothetical protein